MTKFDKVDIEVDNVAVDEMARGMMYAELAITDNKEGTLDKVAKSNPWHAQALKLITGSDERAHLPLRDILYEDMGRLILDCEIDVSGITKGGQFLDTQGYVAHNNDYVVVAFRCTTSIFDWMTNFNTSSSAWEIKEDLEQGYSGICSGLDGLCCQGSMYKPRVHTGFYNNLLAALPDIERHVSQYLTNYERPRKLYIVGHSLGAGIANLTATYFLLNYNWKLLPQSLVLVTAGSPRSICTSMKSVVDEKVEEYGKKKVRFYRIVKGKDVVTSVPPKILGYAHMCQPTVLTDEGKIVLRLEGVGDAETDVIQLFTLKNETISVEETTTTTKTLNGEDNDTEDDTDEESDPEQAKYNAMVAKIPRALRDHMPDFYLKPLFKAKGIECGSLRPQLQPIEDEEGEESSSDKSMPSAKGENRSKNRPWVPKLFRKRRNAANKQPAGPVYF